MIYQGERVELLIFVINDSNERLTREQLEDLSIEIMLKDTYGNLAMYWSYLTTPTIIIDANGLLHLELTAVKTKTMLGQYYIEIKLNEEDPVIGVDQKYRITIHESAITSLM